MSQRVEQALQRLAAQRFPEPTSDQVRDRIVPWEQPEHGAVTDPLAGEGPARTGVRRRRVLIAAGLTVAAATGSVVAVNWLSSSSSQAIATPPLLTFQPAAQRTAAEVLTSLAELAARQPAPRGTGAMLYTARRDWTFGTALDTAGQHRGSGLSEYLEETWLAPDGTGRFLRVEQNVPAGQPFTMDLPLPLPASSAPEMTQPTPEALRDWMLRQGQGWTTADWFQAPRGWARLLDPATTAVFLRILASRPDIKVDGHTTDRSGRPAVAVSTTLLAKPDSWFPQQRLFLLFSPDTGLPLSTESVGLTVNAQAVGAPVATPATVSYTLWLDAAFVPSTTIRP